MLVEGVRSPFDPKPWKTYVIFATIVLRLSYHIIIQTVSAHPQEDGMSRRIGKTYIGVE